jgi:hypothetical protein
MRPPFKSADGLQDRKMDGMGWDGRGDVAGLT